MNRSGSLANRRKLSVLRLLALAAALVAAGSPAHANTYLFSFTGQQILTALRSSQGYVVEQESAYFAIFIKPNLASFAYVAEYSPNPNSQQSWQATTINDPADLGTSGTFAQFSKLSNTAKVAVLSDANNGGTSADNIFLNHSYAGTASPAPPVGWGANSQGITEILDPNAKFQFLINYAGVLTGPQTFTGKASALISGDTSTMTGTKDFTALSFSLSGSPIPIPEPAAWLLVVIGLGALVAIHRRRQAASSSRL